MQQNDGVLKAAGQFIVAERARRLAARGNMRGSADLLDALVNDDGAKADVHPKVLDLAARVHAQLGEMETARGLWARAARKDPGDAGYARALRRCERALKPGLAGFSARRALPPALAGVLVICLAAGGWLAVMASSGRLGQPHSPSQVGVTPSPADTLRKDAAELLGLMPNASSLQVSVTESCVLLVSGQVETLRDRYEAEQRLAGLPGATAIDVSKVGIIPFYVVEPGDTLWSVAERLLGNSHQWQALADANGLGPPYSIHPGDRLRVP